MTSTGLGQVTVGEAPLSLALQPATSRRALRSTCGLLLLRVPSTGDRGGDDALKRSRFIIEKVITESSPEDVYFWATHNGAELDLLLLTPGRRVGVDVKRVAAPNPVDGGRCQRPPVGCALVSLHYSVRRDKAPFLSGANPARQLSCVDASENASPFCVSSFATDPGGYRYAPAQVSIKPTSPVAARDSAASQASSARVC